MALSLSLSIRSVYLRERTCIKDTKDVLVAIYLKSACPLVRTYEEYSKIRSLHRKNKSSLFKVWSYDLFFSGIPILFL